ncbi:3',5'-cyclic-nucleotide phosphodiesterase [Vibrio ishigakensis]|uniref:3',5'-cyclic adenosine monophosphate phosphodiesterase CpdA n=1 Tax=Vibrio ishigakensis TaxID=1481914 RepID=A0A0B8NRX1_9VIBR|nr:3',5'-cyclic-AMP phosphodiesterase [Vibrio ishigakensis]GAM55057.1 3',5'-cyclic-nucleotide phosphodiesterase [Vibrio ishigakensis]
MEPRIVETGESVQLVQITDTHLFEDSEGTLLSVNTEHSFHAVVEDVISKELAFDAIIATGDISQDHTAASYEKFVEGIKPLVKPCFWLPGNHDYKPSMGSVLPSAQIQACNHFLAGEKWQVILLDSQVTGLPHGYLEQEQLAYLDDMLAEYPERHSLVLLHHNPLPIGSAWLDQHKLQKAVEFWQVLDRHKNVSAVLCGHVHQEFQTEHHGVQVLATPSTCIQFKANNDEFALDNLSPGWRHLSLHSDGSIESKVYRLPDGSFVPDFEAEGY